MKTLIKTAAALLTITLLTINPVSAQNGDPPPPPGEHGQTGNQLSGGGAPVGSGLVILLALGAAYGGKKAYELKKKLNTLHSTDKWQPPN